MVFFLISLLSIAAVGGIAAAGGGGGGGGGGGDSFRSSSFDLPVDPKDALVSQGETNSFKTGEYKNQYGLASIKAAEAYKSLQDQGKVNGGEGVKIGISDSGVDFSHRDILSNQATGAGITQYNDNFDTDASHGTHVAGIAAGVKDNAFIHGVAFNSKIVSANIFNNRPDVVGEGGIAFLANSGVKVINMSWGYSILGITDQFATIGDSTYNSLLARLNTDFASAVTNDIVMVAATGNSGSNTNMAMPALFSQDAATNGQMIAVAAVGKTNAIASFSNQCKQARNFCLVAPGVDIKSTISSNPFYEEKDGTSMAAPHVAGAVAVLRAAFPSLTASQSVTILLQTATDIGAAGVDDVFGRGLLNLQAAVQPIGPSSLLAGQTIQSNGYDAQLSSITTNPIFGNAYSKNLAPILKNAVFFDSFGRDYKANLDQKISGNNNSHNLDNLLFANYSNAALPVSFGENYSNNLAVKFTANNIFTDPTTGEVKRNRFGLKHLTVDKSKEDQNGLNSTDVAFSYSKSFGQNLKIGFNKNDFSNDFSWNNPAQNYNLISYNNFTSSPYGKLSLANFSQDGQSQINSNQLNIAQNLTPNLSTSLSYTSYNQSSSVARFSSDQSRIFESGLNYKLNDKTKLGFNLGNLQELNNNFLGSSAKGAFSSGDNPKTKYFSLNVTRNLFDNWQLTTSYSEGKTNVSGNNLGVFRDFNDIRSRGMAVGLLNDNFFKGKLAVVYSEPLRVYRGTTNIDIPVSRDMEGNVQRMKVNNVSLTPDGKEKDLEFSYSFNLKNSDSQINFNSIIQQEANNIKDAPTQYLWMARYNLKF